jgi:hypothetical protein
MDVLTHPAQSAITRSPGERTVICEPTRRTIPAASTPSPMSKGVISAAARASWIYQLNRIDLLNKVKWQTYQITHPRCIDLDFNLVSFERWLLCPQHPLLRVQVKQKL